MQLIVRRFSCGAAQQQKFVQGLSSKNTARTFSTGYAKISKMQQSRKAASGNQRGIVQQAYMESKEFDKAIIHGARQVNGNMTDTGMYNWRVAAINNALAKRGKATGPLTVEDLTSLGHLDQYHYMGTEACDEAIDILGLDEHVHVLDIGSGIGGPSRYMSLKSGCSITGVELQNDLNVAARDLTERVNLHNKVRFVTGDFVSCYQANDPLLRVGFDHMISMLVILHVPDRQALLKASYDSLKPGATFLIEDFARMGGPFTEKEASDLKNVVSAHTVTSPAEYVASLEEAGFVDVEVVDLSEPWRKWTKARHESYRESKEETIKMHGEKLFNDRVAFYEVIDELFAGGNLGGVRITGRKMGLQEKRLQRGRVAHSTSSHSRVAVLNELGSTVSK